MYWEKNKDEESFNRHKLLHSCETHQQKKKKGLSRDVNIHSFESLSWKVPEPQSSPQKAGSARSRTPLMYARSAGAERCNIVLALSKIYWSFHRNTFQDGATAWRRSTSSCWQHKFCSAASSCIDKKNNNLSTFIAFDQDVYIFNHKSPLSPRAALAETPDLELRSASLDKSSSSLWWSLKLSSTRPWLIKTLIIPGKRLLVWNQVIHLNLPALLKNVLSYPGTSG